MSKIKLFILGVILISVFFVALGNTVLAQDELVIKVAGISPIEYRSTEGLYRIAEKVEEATKGRIKMDVFPMNQLGDYTQVFQEIQRGTIDA